MNGPIAVKRIYESPSADDGCRVLVDRLWPRGVSKEAAAVEIWAKHLAPSDELRRWFHADREARFEEFAARYAMELEERDDIATELAELRQAVGDRRLTLLTAAADPARSHVPVIRMAIGDFDEVFPGDGSVTPAS